MAELRRALEASWDKSTAYLGAHQQGNPSLGQCYPTSRVLQTYFPALEVIEGVVWNGKETEKHFWNLLSVDGIEYHLDMTWQQFPAGSYVQSWNVRDRQSFNDSQPTVERIQLLHDRVAEFLRVNA